VIVSGHGSINPKAEIFQHHFSPIIILTSESTSEKKLRQLRSVADDVKAVGKEGVDFEAAFRWLREKWNVKRLLCEGGGEVNGAVFRAWLVDELHLTISPLIFGGRDAPTLADGPGVERLADAARLRLVSMKRVAADLFLVYRRDNRSSRKNLARV
jgi:riboflavin-specific deaminase-like protein